MNTFQQLMVLDVWVWSKIVLIMKFQTKMIFIWDVHNVRMVIIMMLKIEFVFQVLLISVISILKSRTNVLNVDQSFI